MTADTPDFNMPKPKKRTVAHREIARQITEGINRSSLAKRRAQQAREHGAAYDMLQRHCGQLSEHFTNIQIIATKLEPNGATSDYAAGSGDLHARVHMAGCWVRRVEGMYEEGM